MKIQDNVFKVIEQMRFPLVVCVVFIHGFGENNVFWERGIGYDTYEYLRITLSRVLSSIAVPIFFMFSGFLFFVKLESWSFSVYVHKLKRRVNTLVIPYLLWNLLQLLLVFCMYLKGMMTGKLVLTDLVEYLSNSGWLHLFWDSNLWDSGYNVFGQSIQASGPILLPFWYIRNLIILAVISPFIFYLNKRMNLFFIGIVFVAFILGIKINILQLDINSLFFYTLGAYFAMYRIDFLSLAKKINAYIFPLTLCLLFLGFLFYKKDTPLSVIIFNIYLLFAMISCISLFVKLSKDRNSSTIYSKMSFFIYASHPLLILYFSRSILSIILPYDYSIIHIIHYLLSPILAVGICCGLYLFIRKIMPELLNLLTGNRG